MVNGRVLLQNVSLGFLCSGADRTLVLNLEVGVPKGCVDALYGQWLRLGSALWPNCVDEFLTGFSCLHLIKNLNILSIFGTFGSRKSSL